MKWWQTKVAYELYPKSFLDTKGQGSGTIRGIIDAFPSVRSVKDIAVHDYGPDRRLHTMRIVGEISPDSAAEMKRRIRAALGTDAVIEIENDADRNNRGQIRQE